MVSVNDKSITLKVIKRRKINVNVYKPSSFECHVYSAEFGINYEFQYMYYGMREFDEAESAYLGRASTNQVLAVLLQLDH